MSRTQQYQNIYITEGIPENLQYQYGGMQLDNGFPKFLIEYKKNNYIQGAAVISQAYDWYIIVDGMYAFTDELYHSFMIELIDYVKHQVKNKLPCVHINTLEPKLAIKAQSSNKFLQTLGFIQSNGLFTDSKEDWYVLKIHSISSSATVDIIKTFMHGLAPTQNKSDSELLYN